MTLLSLALKPMAYLSLPFIILHHMSSRSTMARYYIRLALYISTLGLCSVWGVILSIVMPLAGRRFDINYVVARTFLLIAGRSLDISFQVEGEEYLESGKPAVIVGNHQSMLDILYLGRILPRQSSILAKKELKWTPLLGQFMLLSGAIFVDRANSKNAVKSLAVAGRTMKNRRTSVWFFPEGTRSSQELPNLLPFKKGAFNLAVQAGVPIVPVVCENYWRLYRAGVFESGTLRLRVLPPISTQGLTAEDVVDLANHTRETMLAALLEISPTPSSQDQDPKHRGSVSPSSELHSATNIPPPKEASVSSEPRPPLGFHGLEGETTVGKGTEGSRVSHIPEGSETSSVSGEQTEEDEGMVLVGRPT